MNRQRLLWTSNVIGCVWEWISNLILVYLLLRKRLWNLDLMEEWLKQLYGTNWTWKSWPNSFSLERLVRTDKARKKREFQYQGRDFSLVHWSTKGSFWPRGPKHSARFKDIGHILHQQHRLVLAFPSEMREDPSYPVKVRSQSPASSTETEKGKAQTLPRAWGSQRSDKWTNSVM